MFWKPKRRQSDILFSQYLREKRGYKCEKCGKKHDPKSKNLGVSHFWPRARENTRFDEYNCDIFCNIPCHKYFETHRTEYKKWKMDQLEEEYPLLEFRANQYKKRDDKMDLLMIKALVDNK